MTLVARPGPASRPDSSRQLALGVGVIALAAGLGAALSDPVTVLAVLLGVAGAVVIMRDPTAGLLAIAVFTVLRLPQVATDFHGAPSLFLPLVAVIIISLTLRSLHGADRPSGGWRAAAVIGGFAAVALASVIFSADVASGLHELDLFLRDAAVAVLAGMLLRDSRTLRAVVWVLVGGGLALSALSMFQYLTGTFGSAYGGFAQSAVQNIVGSTDDVRISGPIGDPNFYAQWLIMLIPLAIDRFYDETSLLLKGLAGTAAGLGALTVVLTFSRGGLVALVVVIGLMVLRHPPRPRTLGLLLLSGVLLVPMLPAGYVERTLALTDLGGVDIGTDPSLRYRTTEAASAWRMFTADPLGGVGYGNFLPSYTEYTRSLGLDLTQKPREAHNLYLETAAETGVPGIIALGAVFVAAFAALTEGRRRFRRGGDHTADGIGYAIAVAIAGYLITSVFLHMAFARLIWLVLGLALAFPSAAAAQDRHRDAVLETAR